MSFEEQKFEMKEPTKFRRLVGDLIEGSDLFKEWVNPVNPDDKMSIIDAIENDRMAEYTGNKVGGKKLNAIECLMNIHEQLKKPDITEEFIEQAIEQLREYL